MTRASHNVASRIVIIADDLSGAADSAIPCAIAGLDTRVRWGGAAERTGGAAVLAIDADTRGRGRAEAVAATRRLTAAHGGRERLLFRKIDSTLRGHPAHEIAATLAVRREETPDAIAILAPAFPAAGRTTRDGRQLLDGQPLELAPIWQRERIAGRAYLPEMLATAGLRAASIPLEAFRGDAPDATIARALASRPDVLVFDAETDGDLARVAASVRRAFAGREIVWIGSAGLARHLAEPPHGSAPALPRAGDGPILFIVGSASAVSHRQAAALSGAGVATVVVTPETLQAAGGSAAARARGELDAAIGAGRDTMLLLGGAQPDLLSESSPLPLAMAGLAAPLAARIAALVCTGGETARAVLDGFGVTGLRLRGEIEPGIPVSVAEGPRPIPIVTKAGAFGRDDSFLRCRAALRGDPLP